MSKRTHRTGRRSRLTMVAMTPVILEFLGSAATAETVRDTVRLHWESSEVVGIRAISVHVSGGTKGHASVTCLVLLRSDHATTSGGAVDSSATTRLFDGLARHLAERNFQVAPGTNGFKLVTELVVTRK